MDPKWIYSGSDIFTPKSFVTTNPLMKYSPPAKFSKVTILVEDEETGETVVHTFARVKNFNVGLNAIGDEEYSDDTWGMGYPGEIAVAHLPNNHFQIASTGVAMPTPDSNGTVGVTRVLPK